MSMATVVWKASARRTCHNRHAVTTLQQTLSQTFRETIVESLSELSLAVGPLRLLVVRGAFNNVLQRHELGVHTLTSDAISKHLERASCET